MLRDLFVRLLTIKSAVKHMKMARQEKITGFLQFVYNISLLEKKKKSLTLLYAIMKTIQGYGLHTHTLKPLLTGAEIFL